MSVYGKQIQDVNSPFIQQIETIRDFSLLDQYIDESRILIQDRSNPFIPYTKDNYFLWYFLSNVCACYRKTYLLKNPFPMIDYGEDYLLGKKIIQENLVKVYDSRIIVMHSADLGFKDYYKKELLDLQFYNKTIGIEKKINFSKKINAIIAQKGFLNKLKSLIILIFYNVK